MIPYGIYLSLSDLHHLVWWSLFPFMLLHMAWFNSFFIAESYSILYMNGIFIYSSVDGHLDCFYVLVLVYGAAMSKEVCVSFWITVVVFFLNICPEVWFLDHMKTTFIFWRNFHAVFHSGYASLHFHQQCRRIFFFHALSSMWYFKIFKL